MIVRDATVSDLAAITKIYNDVVASSSAIWRDDPTTLTERRAWFDQQAADGHAVVVACDPGPSGEAVVGFASLADFRSKSGYWPTVEHTIHVDASHRGRGIGAALLDELVDRAQRAGKQVMVAGVDGDNPRSVAFHERHGFREVGRMPAIGRKFGRPVDLVLLQRDLGDNP